MKKIRIDSAISLGDTSSTVGVQLQGLLEGIPTDNAKEAVKQLAIADELKVANDKKKQWFNFEDADLAPMERVVDQGAKAFAPRIIAPIRIALDKAESFKGEEPKK